MAQAVFEFFPLIPGVLLFLFSRAPLQSTYYVQSTYNVLAEVKHWLISLPPMPCLGTSTQQMSDIRVLFLFLGRGSPSCVTVSDSQGSQC